MEVQPKANQKGKQTYLSTNSPANRENLFDKQWPTIQILLHRLLNNQTINKAEWQDLFCDVYKICSWDPKGSEKLLRAIRDAITSMLRDTKPELVEIESCQLLREYYTHWTEFSQHCHRLPIAFQQLDSATRNVIFHSGHNNNVFNHTNKLVFRKRGESTVRTLMVKLWNDIILQSVEARLVPSALKLIQAERNGDIIDPQLIVCLKESFTSVDDLHVNNYVTVWMEHFEDNYKSDTLIYYNSKAREIIRKSGTLDYISWASSKLAEEETRAKLYIRATSVPSLYKLMVETLVLDYVEDLLETAQKLIYETHGIVNDSKQSVKAIYDFLSPIKGAIRRLLEHFQDYVQVTCLCHLHADKKIITLNCEQYVERLLSFHQKYQEVVVKSFSGDARAKESLEQAFERVINDVHIFEDDKDTNDETTLSMNKRPRPVSRCPELFAGFCDILLRRTSYNRKLSIEQIQEKLNQVLDLVKLIGSKDTFLRYHKTHLTRRLILDVTISRDLEVQFISSLRAIQGMPSDELNRINRMFKDMDFGIAFQEKFSNDTNCQSLSLLKEQEPILINNNNYGQQKEQIESSSMHPLTISKKREVALRIEILNPTAWSHSKTESPAYIPEMITSLISEIETFYHSEYTGRKLHWCNQLSNGTVKYDSNEGSYELDMTGAQLAILSAFDKPSRQDLKLTLEELEQESMLKSMDLKRTLWVSWVR